MNKKTNAEMSHFKPEWFDYAVQALRDNDRDARSIKTYSSAFVIIDSCEFCYDRVKYEGWVCPQQMCGPKTHLKFYHIGQIITLGLRMSTHNFLKLK